MIRSSLDEEEQKLFINRKRKSSIGSDDEYNSQSNTQIRRHEEPTEESDESEDEEEDSDDEDIEDKVSGLFFQKNEPNSGNVGHFYDGLHNSFHVPNGSRIDGQSHVPLNSYVDPTQQHNELESWSDINGDNGTEDWTESLLNNTSGNRRIAWNRFGVPETEAAVAVESILNGDEEDEQDMSVDLSGIEGLDDNLEDDNEEEEDDDEEDDDEEEDDEEDVVNGFSMGGDGHQHQQHVDVQMQCAIKSILDMPSVGSLASQHNSYAFHSHGTHPSLHQHLNEFRNMDYPHIPNIHDQRRDNFRSYGGQQGVNDPILDEAVKSILS